MAGRLDGKVAVITGASRGIGLACAERLAQGFGHREEMPRQIPAVDGRDVTWIERLEPVDVVPVVEVAAEAIQPVQRVQRSLDSIHHLDRADPREVARGDDRQEVDPDVGR